MRQTGRRVCYSSTAQSLGCLAVSQPVKIVRHVKAAGLTELFDVEVADAHEYVVNGVVSHNTVNLPHDATVDDVKTVYDLAIETGLKGTTVFRDGCRPGVLTPLTHAQLLDAMLERRQIDHDAYAAALAGRVCANGGCEA